MSGKIVAVLGISGVGKSTMVRSFVEKYPAVLSVSASELLKHQLSENNSEKLRTAASTTVLANQNHLAMAFTDFRGASYDKNIIFDGHSIIDNEEGVIVIPTSIYEAIDPSIIIFIEEAPATIAVRRQADSSRQRPKRRTQELGAQQRLAKDTALAYGRKLSVTCEVITSSDSESFERIIFEALGNTRCVAADHLAK